MARVRLLRLPAERYPRGAVSLVATCALRVGLDGGLHRNAPAMKHIATLCLIGLPWILGACGESQHPKTNGLCSPATLTVGDNKIWVDREGAGDVTVAFEAGFGLDSTIWVDITPRIRKLGVQTFVYDRAGLGRSTIDTSQPYSIDNDVHILETVLTSCNIDGPIVLVGHSYGGGIGIVAASEDARLRGLVLLDALVPKVFGQGELEKNLATLRSQYKDVRRDDPELAKVAIPWAEALPETVKRIDGARLSRSFPIIDIVAEHGSSTEEGAIVWRDAHVEFASHHPSREYILANGASLKVMADKPDLVVDAIQRMIDRVK